MLHDAAKLIIGLRLEYLMEEILFSGRALIHCYLGKVCQRIRKKI